MPFAPPEGFDGAERVLLPERGDGKAPEEPAPLAPARDCPEGGEGGLPPMEDGALRESL
jgi:hypothetical protein